jgi:hypothetical protein
MAQGSQTGLRFGVARQLLLRMDSNDWPMTGRSPRARNAATFTTCRLLFTF